MAQAETLTRMQADMKEAMKARDADKLGAIRMLLASLQNKQIETRRDLTEDEIVSVLATEAKKRREAAEAFRNGGRAEMADKEDAELVVIEGYLPRKLEESEVAAIIDELIASTGAAGPSEMGKIMGPLMTRIKGQFDGGRARAIATERLSQ